METKNTNKIYAYLVPFILYISIPLLNFLNIDQYLLYALRTIIIASLIIYFWKKYELKIKLDLQLFQSLVIGLLIFGIWISIDRFYPHLGTSIYNPYESTFPLISIISKIVGMVFIAAIVEELFTRGFLMRILISKNWERVKIGTFTLFSFIVTVLFFGFAHERWLAGIITGIILNLWIYKKKDIFATITAHSTANLALAIYVLVTQNWSLW